MLEQILDYFDGVLTAEQVIAQGFELDPAVESCELGGFWTLVNIAVEDGDDDFLTEVCSMC